MPVMALGQIWALCTGNKDDELAGYLVGRKLVHIEPDGILRTACALHVWLVQVTSRASPPAIHQLLILLYMKTMAVQSG